MTFPPRTQHSAPGSGTAGWETGARPASRGEAASSPLGPQGMASPQRHRDGRQLSVLRPAGAPATNLQHHTSWELRVWLHTSQVAAGSPVLPWPPCPAPITAHHHLPQRRSPRAWLQQTAGPLSQPHSAEGSRHPVKLTSPTKASCGQALCQGRASRQQGHVSNSTAPAFEDQWDPPHPSGPSRRVPAWSLAPHVSVGTGSVPPAPARGPSEYRLQGDRV